MKSLETLFFRRPRILNQLHRIGLVAATSQTNEDELRALARHASGRRRALEIGTYQGVSAARIANAMNNDGRLFCIDPWPQRGNRSNPGMAICMRHLSRTGAIKHIAVIRGFSSEVRNQIPIDMDFAFIDGDHSWQGIDTDWKIVIEKLSPGGLVCLHDSFVPEGQEWRRLDSSKYFEEIITNDQRFSLIERVHTLAVLRRL